MRSSYATATCPRHSCLPGARRALTVPLPGAALPSLFWIATARPDRFTAEQVQALEQLVEHDASVLDRPESRDAELARLRRLASVEELAPALFTTLDVHGLLGQVSEITKSVVPHDVVQLITLSDDHAQRTVHVHGASVPAVRACTTGRRTRSGATAG